jgi:hypothetical protein
MLAFRDVGADKETSKMVCVKVDDHLDRITAMAISSNRQVLALACKYLNDKSAYVFFYDLTQNMRRVGKTIHEGTPTDSDDKSFVSIAFSPEAMRIAALTNLKLGNAKLYEWKKDVRVIAACSWLDELKKESKAEELAEARKITFDPSNKDQVCLSGKNHLRVWRNLSGILKLLPPIAKLDSKKVFTDHVWLDSSWLVCGTDKGEVCFIYDSRQCVLVASAFAQVAEGVSCLLPSLNGLIVASDNGLLALWEKKETGKLEDETALREANVHIRNLSTGAYYCC